MSPVLQRPVALAARVTLSVFLLGKMTLAIRDNAPHMFDV
jgi:hypothetical protein